MKGKKGGANTIIAYKGFDENLSCRGFQYAIGKTYVHDGDVTLCESGFHACEVPLDVWRYYKPCNSSKYAQVELGGAIKETSEDSKLVGNTITIKAALTIPMLIKAQVEWTITHAEKNIATGDYGHAAATGYYGHAAATGDYGNAFAGYGGRAKAGAKGAFAICWFDENAKRSHIIVGTPGENGIEADTWYSVDENGKLKEIK